MEIIINIVIVCLTFLVTLYVEIFMYRKPISEKEIADCRKDHERCASAVKEKYDMDWWVDPETEILKSRKLNRSFVLTFAGQSMALVVVGLLIFHLPITFANIAVICSSGIILICYGIIRVAETKLLAIGLLVFVVVTGIIMDTIMNKLLTDSPFAYFYLCGFIAVLAILTFIPRVQKFAESH